MSAICDRNGAKRGIPELVETVFPGTLNIGVRDEAAPASARVEKPTEAAAEDLGAIHRGMSTGGIIFILKAPLAVFTRQWTWEERGMGSDGGRKSDVAFPKFLVDQAPMGSVFPSAGFTNLMRARSGDHGTRPVALSIPHSAGSRLPQPRSSARRHFGRNSAPTD